MKRFPFFLFALPLFGTVNEPLRGALFSGYRNDRIHWHLGEENATTYTEIDRDVEFWQNGLSFKTIHRDLAFYLDGSYSAFGRGTAIQDYESLSFASDTPSFHFSTSGWAADTSGFFGYAVNLTADRTYKVILLPLVGYSAHFEELRRKNGSPELLYSTEAIGADAYTMSASLPGEEKISWYGFFLGGGFQIQPGGNLNFSAGYTYHFLSHRFKSQFENRVSLFNPLLVSEITTSTKLKAKNGAIGQSGWAEFTYLLSRFWRIGLGAKVHYFSTKAASVEEEVTETPLFPAGPAVFLEPKEGYKMRFTSISGWLTVVREF